eukprot:625842-Rhodomonas_salina.2
MRSAGLTWRMVPRPYALCGTESAYGCSAFPRVSEPYSAEAARGRRRGGTWLRSRDPGAFSQLLLDSSIRCLLADAFTRALHYYQQSHQLSTKFGDFVVEFQSVVRALTCRCGAPRSRMAATIHYAPTFKDFKMTYGENLDKVLSQ